MNWPWSDLLTDVVLTSVGGLGVKGRGEGVVWMGEPLRASDSVKRKETNHCSQGCGAPFGGSGGRTGVPKFLKVHLFQISDVLRVPEFLNMHFRQLALRTGVPESLKVHFLEISDALFCAQESLNF